MCIEPQSLSMSVFQGGNALSRCSALRANAWEWVDRKINCLEWLATAKKISFGQVSGLIPSRRTPQDVASPPTVNDRATSPSGCKPISQTPNIIYELHPGTRVIIHHATIVPFSPSLFSTYFLSCLELGGGERSLRVSIDSTEMYFVKFKENTFDYGKYIVLLCCRKYYGKKYLLRFI